MTTITGVLAADLTAMDALTLAAAIRTKAASCAEVMAAYLRRIDRVNPHVNAIVSRVDEADLMAQARAADAEIARGTYRGWMHGLPHAVKDTAPTKGIRTTFGSRLFADLVPEADAIFVERLRAAGAIIIGKTNVPDLALGSHTVNPVFGATGNAYDPTKSAGGSSGGAAVGLALHMLPVADGSDFGGSLRNPAGWNNVFGFRPSFGRVPGGPAPELFLQQLGGDGPMARNVSDLAALLSVMAGRDERAPLSLTQPAADFAAPLARDGKGVRIGWLAALDGSLPMAPGMLDLCRGALARMETKGCIVEEASLGIDRDIAWNAFVTLRQGLVAGRFGALYENPRCREKFPKTAVWEIENGLRLSAVDFYKASEQRSRVYDAFRRLFQRYDVVALPSAQVFPFDATLDWPREIAGVAMDTYHRWMEVTFAPTLAGCPVACVPAGFGPGGLPSGLQLIGPPQRDFAVLQMAHAYEEVTRDVIERRSPPFAT